jgi:hypothetical protein
MSKSKPLPVKEPNPAKTRPLQWSPEKAARLRHAAKRPAVGDCNCNCACK